MKTKLSIFIDTSLGHSRKDRHFVKTQKFDNVLIPSTQINIGEKTHQYDGSFFVSGPGFEIERFPHRFEQNLQCVSATHSLVGDGAISVYNRVYKFRKAKWMDIIGSANVPRQQFPGEIKVSFFKPYNHLDQS